MKATLFDVKGNKKSEVTLPELFEIFIRPDISQKLFEVAKSPQPYSAFEEAGRRHSAAGTISHRRHEWKGHYGKGISRVPRKTMWRRGTQFMWVGAEVSAARGGRKAHAPELNMHFPRINKKEIQIAMKSAFASTASPKFISSRYSSLSNVSHIPIPAIIESLPSKTKELKQTLEKIYGTSSNLLFKNKVQRTGKGKQRGRKYKSSQGALIVISDKEKASFKGIDVKPFDEVSISDIYPLGRITIYTKKAIDSLSETKEKKETKK